MTNTKMQALDIAKSSRTAGIIVLMVCTATLLGAQVTTPTSTETREVKRAWESLIRAKGGREKLYSITNMVTEYGQMTTVYGFPDSEWNFHYQLDGKTPSLIVGDGEKSVAYSCGPAGLVSVVHYDWKGKLAFDHLLYLLETKWFKPELVRVTRIKDGKKQIDVIETTIGGQRVDFVYEAEELMVSEVRLYSLDGRLLDRTGFSDYGEINGIKIPRKITLGWKNERMSEPLPITILLNVDYDPAIFTRPAKATTPDAWKRKP